MGSVTISHSHEVGGVPFPWTGTFLGLAFPSFFGGKRKEFHKSSRNFLEGRISYMILSKFP